MEQHNVVILDAASGLVHILPVSPQFEWEDEEFQDALEQMGISNSNSEWMVVKGNDFLRLGW